MQRGWMAAGGCTIPCALGRSGLKRIKREGDGAGPIGRFVALQVLYRPDHIRRPPTRLPVRALRPADGWCDDPSSPAYNRPVRLPFRGSHERLWRDDALYDLVLVLDHNQRPRQRGAGSAVFVHVARPDFAPTEGCVALRRRDLEKLVGQLSPGSVLALG